MSKKAFNEVLAGIEDGIAYARGDKTRGVEHVVEVPETVDVRAIRTGFGLSQQKFAEQFGFDARALQEWEQGRRYPDRTARILMTVIARRPDAVVEALAGAGPGVIRVKSVKATTRRQATLLLKQLKRWPTKAKTTRQAKPRKRASAGAR